MTFTKWCVLVLSAVLWTSSTQGGRILGVFPMPAPSHYFLGHKLLRELAAQGHEVTMVSPYKNKEPILNYRDIEVSGMSDAIALVPKRDIMSFMDLGKLSSWMQAIMFTRMSYAASEVALRDKAFQDLLQSNETFDLVILEMFHFEMMYGVAHRFNCPLMIIGTFGSSILTNHLVGNPAPNSYVPDFLMKFSSHMSFVQRLQNAVHYLILHVHRKFIYYPRLDAQLHQYFLNVPPLEELMHSQTALILLNSHPSVTASRPHVPSMVEIGGFHIDEPKPLTKDLKDFMDTAEHGVILFSMGSNVKSTDFANETVKVIVKSFAKLKQQVIWKWENENLLGKPENVKFMKWCPQNDILAHPNLKLFITHGGLLSATEAVYHGVPMIGIPIFGDQRMNVATWSNYGFCIGINYDDISEDTFTATLQEILNNPKYRNNVKHRSQLLRDRPIRPIDAAVYWTEYVIKYKDVNHLRTAAMDLEWYQLYSIDLIVLVIVMISVIFVLLYNITKKLFTSKKKQDMKNMMKKKN